MCVLVKDKYTYFYDKFTKATSMLQSVNRIRFEGEFDIIGHQCVVNIA